MRNDNIPPRRAGWPTTVAAFLLGTFATLAVARADTWELQSNPVAAGTIQIDGDRSDWMGLTPYEVDEDEVEFFPIDIDDVTVVHDASHVYFRVRSLAWETDETWRIGLYIDTDGDAFTGYNGNFLAVGSDYFVENNGLFEFTAGSQAEWGWAQAAEISRDQSVLTDYELSIPLDVIGRPESIDFLLFANNFCCDFGEPDDIYPNTGNSLEGDFFTYELTGAPAPPGDFDGDAMLGNSDVDLLINAIIAASDDSRFDLTADSMLDGNDLDVWVQQYRRTWYGDANLDGEFNSSDLVVVFSAGKFEQEMDATWGQGDWNLDGRFTTSDLVTAFADGGFENGPRAATAAVPEPGAIMLLALGLICAAVGKRK